MLVEGSPPVGWSPLGKCQYRYQRKPQRQGSIGNNLEQYPETHLFYGPLFSDIYADELKTEPF